MPDTVKRPREAKVLAYDHTVFTVLRIWDLFWPQPLPSDLNVPGVATSYSTWKRASWLHCCRVAIAVAWLAPCSGIPSMLSSLSPTFKEPSLEGR